MPNKATACPHCGAPRWIYSFDLVVGPNREVISADVFSHNAEAAIRSLRDLYALGKVEIHRIANRGAIPCLKKP
jgi:hypothetical protein